MLKAKISQTKSNLYAVKTTKYDTTDIELIVETTDSSPWLNPKFELLGIKSDGHEVRQTENFKVIDLNNHIVQVTLDEQLVTCEGNVDLQLLIKDGSRKSSTPFKLHVGRSLDSDILESHRNVKVLDELEKYIIEGREYISEATGLAQSTANYVQAVNTQAEANEAKRLQNESQRQSAETKRNEAEDERKQAEVLRVQNEDTRQSAEVIRIANEQTRLENESNRIERETARENKESIRQAQEQKRHTSESTRQSQEATRQSNEDNRKQAEKSRNQEEAARINNEATRKQAEDNRQSQELVRQSAESARSTAETNRNNAESTRTQNENTRKSQETTRQQKETERQSAEATRQQKEVERQTEETKRLEAEELRKEAYTEATQLLDELRNFEPITENDRTDYMGNVHQTLKAKNDADVDWLLGEINTVHYDGQHITTTDSIEGRAKSAILTGKTLVNLVAEDKKRNTIADGKDIRNLTEFSGSKEYTFYFKVEKINDSGVIRLQYLNGLTFISGENKNIVVGVNAITFTTPANTTDVRLQNANGVTELIIDDFMVIEGNYTNQSIPYFTGMQSVKMPVLTTTGKNLFDDAFFENTSWSTNVYAKSDKYLLKSNTQYTFTLGKGVVPSGSWIRIGVETSDGVIKRFLDYNNTSGVTDYIQTSKSINFTTTDTGVICFDCYHNKNEHDKLHKLLVDIQIEEGSTATPYEPYKSNILTVNEEVELRGIGNVQDELNLMTGEKVERVGEVFSNSLRASGALSIGTYANVIPVNYPVNFLGWDNANLICDKLKTIKRADINWDKTSSINGISLCRTGFWVVVDKTITTQEQANEYLNNLNATIQYELPTTVTKTVDLSDNHVYSYKDVTHYDCSSAEGSLVPTLSIDVPTSLSALVSRQRETIREQEDQIKLLEETNSELIISQETQDEEIVTNMLASVELFEMVLSMAPLSIDMSKSMGVNPMVEVYVTLILKGEKTIEQVPAVIRDKVQAQLDLLTK